MITKRLRKLLNGGYALPPILEFIGVLFFILLIGTDWTLIAAGPQ